MCVCVWGGGSNVPKALELRRGRGIPSPVGLWWWDMGPRKKFSILTFEMLNFWTLLDCSCCSRRAQPESLARGVKNYGPGAVCVARSYASPVVRPASVVVTLSVAAYDRRYACRRRRPTTFNYKQGNIKSAMELRRSRVRWTIMYRYVA